jgi:hypothetical protein
MGKRIGVITTKAFKKRLKRTKKAYAIRKFRALFYFFAKKQNAKARTTIYWRKRKAFYLTLLYFTAAATTASVTQLWFVTVRPETAFGFYTAAGAMAGGMLAIIFTFNTLLVNFALSQYPPEFFRLSGYDKKQDRIYFYIAFLTIALFVMGFMYRDLGSGWNYWLQLLGLFCIFAVLYFVFASYILTRNRLNPIASFSYITKPAFELLDQSDKDAKRLADMLRKDPTLKPDKAYITDYQPQVLLQSRYAQINEFIGYLYDYHDKLLDKKDYSTALNVLDAIGLLILRYIDVRKSSFIMLPSEFLLVPVTDAQEFFDTNFQRLVDRATIYIKLGNQNGTRKVLSLFEGIGLGLREISFPTGLSRQENPPFEQCVSYLGNICDMGIAQNDLEATFQVARAYTVLGSVAVSKGYIHGQSRAYDNLLKLAVYAATKKQWVVMDQIAKAFTAFMQAFKTQNRGALGTEFRIYMEKLGDFYWYYFSLSTASNDYQPQTAIYMVAPLSELRKWAGELAHKGSNMRNPDRDSSQHDVVELADQAWHLLRRLTDRTNITLVDRYLATEFANHIQNMCGLLISSAHKHGWQRHSHEVINKANWLLNQVSFFADNAPNKLEQHKLDDFSETATTIALYALHKGDTAIAVAGINVIYHLATTCLNKAAKSAEYDAPRIMVNGGLVAILALRQNNAEVLRYFKETALKFNAAYNAKYFPNGPKSSPLGRRYIGAPHPDQLNMELRTISRQLREWRTSSFRQMISEQPEDYMIQLAPDINNGHFIALIKYLKHKTLKEGTPLD